MSVLIRGMEMPTSCYACMFFAQTDYWNKEDEADILSRCKRTGEKTWESVNGYLPNCPLIPVPPHGRLIDADALRIRDEEKRAYEAYQMEKHEFFIEEPLLEYKRGVSEGLIRASGIVRFAPTIIPADHIGDVNEMVTDKEEEG